MGMFYATTAMVFGKQVKRKRDWKSTNIVRWVNPTEADVRETG
jgi:hypothetical protein